MWCLGLHHSVPLQWRSLGWRTSGVRGFFAALANATMPVQVSAQPAHSQAKENGWGKRQLGRRNRPQWRVDPDTRHTAGARSEPGLSSKKDPGEARKSRPPGKDTLYETASHLLYQRTLAAYRVRRPTLEGIDVITSGPLQSNVRRHASERAHTLRSCAAWTGDGV